MTGRSNNKTYRQQVDVWIKENGTGLFIKAVLWIIATLLAVTTYFLTGYFHKAEKASDKMETFSESVTEFSLAVKDLSHVVDAVRKDNTELKGRVDKLENWKEQHEAERTKFFQDYELKKKR